MKEYDVCVIGAGPAGITAAIELAENGFMVALIESGEERYLAEIQQLSDAEIMTPRSHDVMKDAVRRGLGGTSALWGGRCVPLDSIDLETRDFIDDSGWPLCDSDLAEYYTRACEILDVGDAAFEVSACNSLATNEHRLSSNFFDTETMTAIQLERWSRSPNVWESFKEKIKLHSKITVHSGLTCVGFRQSQMDSSVTEVLLKPSSNTGQATPITLKSNTFVIACGGVESTRLVLNSIRDSLGLKLQSPDLVGRYYMGHPSGSIADIEFSGEPAKTLYGFEKDGDVYVRRRICLRADKLKKQKLLNIAFWLDNAPLQDWRHGSGVLSAAYLALTTPILGKLLVPAAIRKRVIGADGVQRMKHMLNCIRSPFRTIQFCIQFFWKRYLASPRLPGFFTFSDTNHYALHYHAEQAPNWNSTVTLSDKKDTHGQFRARIALNWTTQDIDSIIRAHSILDEELQATGIGRLIYRYPSNELEQAVSDQAIDGYHQLGTLRMSIDSTTGVTDPFGKLYGTSNCYVASSATFPTSGQANPTLALVALTLRQVDHIASTTSRNGPQYA